MGVLVCRYMWYDSMSIDLFLRAYNVVFGLFQAPYYAFSQTMMAELTPPGFDNMVGPHPLLDVRSLDPVY